MNTCTYCGFQSEALVAVCPQCGTADLQQSSDSKSEEVREAKEDQMGLRDFMDHPEKLFRILVVVATAGSILSVALYYLEPGLVDHQTRSLLYMNGYNAIFQLPESVWWLMTLISIAAAIGLYCFIATARMLYLVFTILNGLMILFGGVYTTTALVGFLGWLSILAQGGIIALAYCSSLKERFS